MNFKVFNDQRLSPEALRTVTNLAVMQAQSIRSIGQLGSWQSFDFRV